MKYRSKIVVRLAFALVAQSLAADSSPLVSSTEEMHDSQYQHTALEVNEVTSVLRSNASDQKLLDAINSLTDYIALQDNSSNDTTIIDSQINNLQIQMDSCCSSMSDCCAQLQDINEQILSTVNTLAGDTSQQDVIAALSDLQAQVTNLQSQQDQAMNVLTTVSSAALNEAILQVVSDMQSDIQALTNQTQLYVNALAHDVNNLNTSSWVKDLTHKINTLHDNDNKILVSLAAINATSNNNENVTALLQDIRQDIAASSYQSLTLVNALTDDMNAQDSTKVLNEMQDTINQIGKNLANLTMQVSIPLAQPDISGVTTQLQSLQNSHEQLGQLIADMSSRLINVQINTVVVDRIASLEKSFKDSSDQIAQVLGGLASQTSSNQIVTILTYMGTALDNLQAQQQKITDAIASLNAQGQNDALNAALQTIANSLQVNTTQLVTMGNALSNQNINAQVMSIITPMAQQLSAVASQQNTLLSTITTLSLPDADKQDIMNAVAALSAKVDDNSTALVANINTLLTTNLTPQIISQLTALQNQVTLLKATLDQSTGVVNALATSATASLSTLTNQISSINTTLTTNFIESTPIAVPGTITAPGSYYLVNDLNGVGFISIAASDVILDLNHHTISNAAQGIVINDGMHNVSVCNGHIRDITNQAILVGNNTQSITVYDVEITNVSTTPDGAAIEFNGTNAAITTNNSLRNISITQSSGGIVLHNAYATAIDSCYVRDITAVNNAIGIAISNDTIIANNVGNSVINTTLENIRSSQGGAFGIMATDSANIIISGLKVTALSGNDHTSGIELVMCPASLIDQSLVFDISSSTITQPCFGIALQTCLGSKIQNSSVGYIAHNNSPAPLSSGIMLFGSANSLVDNCSVVSVGSTNVATGLWVNASSDVVVNSINILDIQATQNAAGIALNAANVILHDCTIDAIQGGSVATGIAADDNGTAINSVSLSNCSVTNVSNGTVTTGQALGYLANTQNSSYSNCTASTISGAASYGFLLPTSSIANLLNNCTAQSISGVQATGFALRGAQSYAQQSLATMINGTALMLDTTSAGCVVDNCSATYSTVGISNTGTNNKIFTCKASLNSTSNFVGVSPISSLGSLVYVAGANIEGL